MGFLKFDQLPSPGDRFVLAEEIGHGVCGRVVKATDNQSSGKVVAIKIQVYDKELKDKIDEEYRVFRDFSQYPNFPSLYGVYRKKASGAHDEVWFVMEYCAGGSVIDMISRLHSQGRRLNEMQIAYIIREVAKALLELHKSHIMSRDVKGSNVVLTGDGGVKFIDYGLAKSFESTLGKLGTCIGSPNWMAPEMFTSPAKVGEKGYGSRADVWALGILAIELGDGHPPFHEMHPTRMMFQILRNPPPTLYRPSNWSQNYNDFIAECLEKNHEHRAYLVEMMEHPFLADLPENDYYISQELRVMNESVKDVELKAQADEVAIFKGGLKRFSELPTKLFVEDLCALNNLNENAIIETLKARQTQGNSYSFAGDVMLSLNSNGTLDEIPKAVHQKYVSKTWSDNPPHIFAVADRAHQYMMHHEDPQFIVLSGETYSGKTTQFNHLIKHLCFIGEGNKNADLKIKESVAVIEALINAGTPINRNSTRAIFQANLIFGKTGKLSGGIHSVYLLEKGRVTTLDMDQSNFHYFYYFYDAMKANNRLKEFDLEDHRNYRYLRTNKSTSDSNYIRDTPEKNLLKFHDVENALLDLDFEKEQLQSVYGIMAAILLLGEVHYQAGEDANARAIIENPEQVSKVARLLKVDEKKFSWALTNYCVIKNGTAERRKHTVDEARDARDSLAAVLYSRLVDWIVNIINQKLAVGRAIFGDHYSITLMDMFGFECYRRNKMEQLFVNCLNEQMQYFYNQRMFVWEMIEQEEEQIPTITDFHFYDNKLAVDQIMSKPYGLLNLMDDSTRSQQEHEQLTHVISTKKMQYVTRVGNNEIGIAHYTGKVSYDARDWPEKNRDFIPPELFEVLRQSTDPLIKAMTSNPLSKTGNLTLAFENPPQPKHVKGKWTGALVAENNKVKKLNTLSHGMFSQVHKMRTKASVFRSTCLEIMKSLSVSASSSGVHFVRCLRINLDNTPNTLQTELVRQQIRAMALVDTAVAGKKGFPYRIPFQEFLRRYKFLGFDFNETVELTRDNCRLLLLRLKMDGWIIGKTKVFLKYYNVEYLSRLYEVQVKKIVKVQAMMRAFLAKRIMDVHIKKQLAKAALNNPGESEKEVEKAAVFIQKAYRGYMVRKQYGPLICSKTGNLDATTADFIRPYASRWKMRSLYQVLLQYRAARHMDLVQFMQQVHIYNQMFVQSLTKSSQCVLLERIDPQQTNPGLLGPPKMSVWKMPFRLDEIPYFDTSYLCDPDAETKTNVAGYDSDDECWDAPLQRRTNTSAKITASANVARHGVGGRETPNLYANQFSREMGKVPMDRRCSSPAPPPSSDHFSQLQSSGLRPVSERIGEFSSSHDTYSVYKKRAHAPAPPPPPSYKAASNSLKKRQAPRPPGDFDESTFENRSPVKGVSGNKSPFNPAKELKMIARDNSAEDDTSDAPFNFQGMLRKTQYNRASMKRDNSNGMSTPKNWDGPKTPLTSNTNPPNVVYHSKGKEKKERPKSAMNQPLKDANQNELPVNNGATRKLSLQQDTLLGTKSPIDLMNNNSVREGSLDEDTFTPETCENYIKEEIAPGVVLEGLVEEV